jgi:hypothetical protein
MDDSIPSILFILSNAFLAILGALGVLAVPL